ncbi:hypothetical protein GPJ56_002256 [Histomonas meleagridis]|uniref:uncharacterized protein n=1 Tax=Histomonas meleagridis TaxID=135588 RepID=UPI00355983C3|nr:hypothetical protein GPJ56_002256 [Histomonas meleagridis]KAH0802948.1 hypothetical protein GO595_004455 [Histomonas meleagridis]
MIITGSNPQNAITICSEQLVKLAAIVYSTITALFGESVNHKFRFECATDLKPEFAKCETKYTSESILADRFTSFLLANQRLTKSTSVDQIAETIEILKSTKESFDFTGDIAASSYIGAIVDSVAHDNVINSITFKGLNFCSFLPHFLPIIKNNPNIKKLTFTCITFIESIDSITKTSIENKLPVKELNFIRCELTTSSFLSFIGYLQTIGSELQSVSFCKCRFSDITIVNLFNYFCNSNCFDNLNSIYFETVRSDNFQKCLKEFFSTNSKAKERIKKLSLIDCNLDVSVILPEVTTSKNSIVNLDLSQNDFKSPLKRQINDFGELTTVSFSGCTFTLDSFKSLFNTLSASRNSPSYLAFDAIRLDSKEQYDYLLTVKLPKLIDLSWKKNKMDSKSSKKFFGFLSNNTSLLNLNLSNTFKMDGIDESIQYFLNYIKKCKLNTLILRAEQPTVYGEHLYPILEELGNESFQLENLDVTGQEIKEKGVELLSQIIDNGLKQLSFDGLAVKSVNSFVNFCQKVTNSGLEKANWPEQDEKHYITKAPQEQLAEIKKLMAQVKKEFIDHFAGKQTSNTSSFLNSPRKKTLVRSDSRGKKRNGTHSKEKKSKKIPKMINTNDLMYREKYIADLCAECLGYEASPANDVLLSKYTQIIELSK